MQNLLEIQPRRLPEWTTNPGWKRNKDGTLQAPWGEGNAQMLRPGGKGNNGENKRWIKVVMYAPESDSTAGKTTHDQMQELARILACISSPMPKAGDRKTCRWGSGEKGTDMSLHHFSRTPSFCPTEALKVFEKTEEEEHLPDGVVPTSLTKHFKAAGMGNEEARAAAGRVIKGCVNDCCRIYEAMLTTRSAALCRNIGANVGTLRTPNSGDALRKWYCDCCEKRCTAVWKIPRIGGDKQDSNIIRRMQEKRMETILARECRLFLPPKKKEREAVKEKTRKEAKHIWSKKRWPDVVREANLLGVTVGRNNRTQMVEDIAAKHGEVAERKLGIFPIEVVKLVKERTVNKGRRQSERNTGMVSCSSCAMPLTAYRQRRKLTTVTTDDDAQWLAVCAIARGEGSVVHQAERKGAKTVLTDIFNRDRRTEEARRKLTGQKGSFMDTTKGEMVDGVVALVAAITPNEPRACVTRRRESGEAQDQNQWICITIHEAEAGVKTLHDKHLKESRKRMLKELAERLERTEQMTATGSAGATRRNTPVGKAHPTRPAPQTQSFRGAQKGGQTNRLNPERHGKRKKTKGGDTPGENSEGERRTTTTTAARKDLEQGREARD